jgi:hypothetical protein
MLSVRYECEACEELLSRYRVAADRFKASTRRLTDIVSSGERDLMSKIWSECREAHAECNSLRKLILAHLQKHNLNS